MIDKTIYQSPFSWRYGSAEMRDIWSISRTRLLWRKIWSALAEVQTSYGLVREDQAAMLASQASNLDLERSLQLEKELKHDLMAELHVFADQCPGAGGILHLGATSMDIKDNALIMQQVEALGLILSRLKELLGILSDRILKGAETPLLGYTHLQPAEPTTLGYRLAGYGQDLLVGYQDLVGFSGQMKAKGFTGAVGTSASFASLIGENNLLEFQDLMACKLGLEFFPVVNQTYPRLQDFQLITRLAGIGGTLYRFAFDMRILQSPGFGEVAEPFSTKQVGSSAMPFKQNPILSEKINSLGRYLAQLPRIAWDNMAHSLLERTLDDSANQRIYLPEAFLSLDEMVDAVVEILSGLDIRSEMIKRNLKEHGSFLMTEKLLMDLVKAGGDRQEMHEIIRSHALKAWDAVRKGDPNPLVESLSSDPAMLALLDEDRIRSHLDQEAYLGDAPERAKRLAGMIREELEG